jgi:hypothetical protein
MLLVGTNQTYTKLTSNERGWREKMKIQERDK